VVAAAAVAAGRDPAAIGMEGQVLAATREPALLARHAAKWEGAGATHLSVNTMGAGCTSVDQHIAAITAAAEVLVTPS
jgi:hypothetical protein